ncbi:phosphotransferase [Nostoc sp. FACHB-152]|uniref:phosphotransferase n=1 Tax=unclassified Nostoc TaxID=2593658 RepID=UPI001685BE5C|nr:MULTISPECIES: phosphotransferase [unclassified Nostoc]MBD2451360.1 phosphotransferase [Nostoc sp. FACHB-152]MBD2472031.1 phosphotransferase [Nostoc sp. FACHB-145]
MAHPSSILWVESIWLDKARSWIDDQLTQHNIQRIGLIEQPHIRHWSTVLKVPTNIGYIYFKAVVPDLVYEASVTQVLANWYPHWMPQILAVDQQQGWLLMKDGGMRLREVLKTENDIRYWESILPIYAQLQQQSAKRVDDLLNSGLPNRCLAILPTKFKDLLADTEMLNLEHTGGISLAEYQRLQECTDLFAWLCEHLASYGLPESLHHGDLHDGNVFIHEGCYLFFDWGDSSISHPFFTLESTFTSLENRFSLEKHSFWFELLKECYLNSWFEYETQEKLLEAFNLAQRLSPILSALRWLPVLSGMDELERSKYSTQVPSLLREFINLNL